MSSPPLPLNLIETGPKDSAAIVILAHGAGAPMDSDFMNGIAARLAAAKMRCIRFEFPYMEERRRSGKKRPPDRQPVLLDRFKTVVRQISETSPDGASLYIGGKSMGGRMATLLAAEPPSMPTIQGVLCLGYPFHPPGKPEKTRTGHFPDILCPVLVCQGERDPFGTRTEIENMRLPSHVSLYWLPDGNHDLAPRVRSGITKEENLDAAVGAMTRFVGAKSP